MAANNRKEQDPEIVENDLWDSLQDEEKLKEEAEKKKKEDPDDFDSALKDFKRSAIFKLLMTLIVIGGLGGIGYGIYELATADFTSSPSAPTDLFDFYAANKDVIWTFVQIGVFGLIMIIFAARDHVTFKKGQHLDSKSIIVSLGVLGTFLGIFLGLMGFDASNITESVPKLLDGLKLAFATSILGMVITIPLTTIQQMPNIDSKSEMRTLIGMSDKLTSVTCLPEMAKNMRKSTEAISNMQVNVRDDLIGENSNRTNEILGSINSRASQTIELLTRLDASIIALAVATKSSSAGPGRSSDTTGNTMMGSKISADIPSMYE